MYWYAYLLVTQSCFWDHMLSGCIRRLPWSLKLAAPYSSGAICWKLRHPLYSFLRMYARQLARRAGREVYFNFWFAAEGVGANNLSTWTKVGAFAALVAMGYLRIRDRGTFDFPFHGRPRPHREESRLRKMTKYLSFYTKEIGFWAIFDTYWTSVTFLFLIGWAAYLFIVQRIVVVSLLTYENIYGETLLDTLTPFFDNRVKRGSSGCYNFLSLMIFGKN